MLKFSSKNIYISLFCLGLIFLAAFYAVAWQEPAQSPPEGNVPAPLNVGPGDQSKEGGLILNTGGESEHGLVVNQGLCLGEDCRETWPIDEGLNTYKMDVSPFVVGSGYGQYIGSKTVSASCPEGTTATQISCRELTYPNGQGGTFDTCSCSINGDSVSVTAYAVTTTQCDYYSYSGRSSTCQVHDGYSCYYYCSAPGPCQIEYMCVSTETTGAYSSETCTTPSNMFALSGSACNEPEDNAYCNTQCTQKGWDHGELASCTANLPNCPCGQAFACGFQTCLPWVGSYDCRGFANMHGLSCHCWND
jgi:hypothetical protein